MPQPAQVSHMLEGRATLRGRNQSGQVIVLVVLGLAVLLGAAALVVDLGYAYSAQRNLQSSADSAALAGAQGLPNVGNVVQFAKQYGSQDKNTHAVSGNVDESITTTASRDRPDVRPMPSWSARSPIREAFSPDSSV